MNWWSRRAALAVGGLSLARLGAAQTAGNVLALAPGHPWLETDNPRVVAADATNLVVLVAPHVRAYKMAPAVSYPSTSAVGDRRILRCGLTCCLNNWPTCNPDGQALFWVQGSRLMRTHIASGETRELTARGALRLALHDGRVHVLNHNNHQKLEAFDVLTGQALGLCPSPRWHALGVGRSGGLAVDQRGAKEPSVLHRIDLVRGERAEVLRTGRARCGLTPWCLHATEDAAQGRTSAVCNLVEHDSAATTRSCICPHRMVTQTDFSGRH